MKWYEWELGLIRAVLKIEHKYFELTKDTPYVTIMGELWGFCYECVGKSWFWYTLECCIEKISFILL